MRIAVVGGTGSFGAAVARRLVAAGEEVTIGSRDAARAAETAAGIGAAGGTANEDAVRDADLVVLAVKADALLETAETLRASLGATPVLCVGSELAFARSGVRPTPEASSLAERLAARIDAPVAAGLHSLAAASLAEEAPDEDALVCGDDEVAKGLALDLAGKLVSGRALDAGPLAGARALEGMTAVIVNLNRRYRGHAGVRITGLP